MRENIVINLHITDACNFKCKHCFAHFGAIRNLSVNEWKSIVDNTLANCNVRRFNLAGGEPLLYGNILELSDYIRSKGSEVSIITNGFNLSEKKIAQLTADTYIMVDAFGNLVDTGSGKNTPVANLLNTGFNEAFERMNFDYENYEMRYAA